MNSLLSYMAVVFLILLITFPVISLLSNYFIQKYATKHGIQERDEEDKQLQARVNNKIAEKESLSGKALSQEEKNQIYNKEVKLEKMTQGTLSSLFKPEKNLI